MRKTDKSASQISILAIILLVPCGVFLSHCKKFEVSQRVIVKTEGVSEVGIQSCKLAGTLVDVGSTGVDNHGFCWSLTTNPAEAIDCNQLGRKDEKVSFSAMIEDLNPGTEYYFWAFASVEGVKTYGDQGQFTTLSAQLPVVETGEVTKIAGTTADCQYNIPSDGGSPVTDRGLCWATDSLPTLTSAEGNTANGNGTGTFTETMTGLNPETDYYVRAWATNIVGTEYGNQQQFRTSDESTVPEVKTISVEKVTSSTAHVSGSITSDGGSEITEKGFCWGTESLPTVDNTSHVVGSGPEPFSMTIEELEANTHYYVRAFASNINGTEYGGQLDFDTPAETTLPVVHTNPVDYIRPTSAQVSGSISFDGGSEITEKGFCWGTSPEPTADNAFQVVGDGPEPFSLTIEGLKSEGHYYVRAFASNMNGISYGEDQEFDTPPETNSPEVETTGLEKVTHNSVLFAGRIISNGGSEIIDKGFCWSTEPDPTFDDDSESAGTGANSFELTITGLIPDTHYFVRAYASNTIGIYSYGEQLEFRTLPEPLSDARNGKIYQTVRIGEQVWMAENLDIGDMINGSLNGSDDKIIQKYCYQNKTENCDTYGAMYNWYELMQYATIENAGGVCPEGWHIPSDEDWKILERTLGMAEADVQLEADWRGKEEGGMLKDEGVNFWDGPNEGATNEFGFNALPAGGMENTGHFSGLGFFTDFWTSTWDGTTPWYRMLDADHASIYRNVGNPGYATSVRCIKD